MKQQKTRQWTYFIIITLAALFFAPLLHAALAQTGVSLSVSPAAAEVDLAESETVIINLLAANAVNLNAFDITIAYDPSLVKFESFQHGGMLSNLYVLINTNQPGQFHLAATQMARPAVNGDGTLLQLTFSGVAKGVSAITISQAIFANPQGVQTVPSLNHGSLEVFPPRYALTGEIWMQGQTARGGISVALSPGSTHAYGPYSAVSLDQSGANLDFGTVVGDSYVLTTNQPRYLNIDAAMDIQVTLGEDTVLPTLKLFGGNAVWTDNVIDISDASVVGAWYEKTLDDLEPEQTLDADINFDGVVNIADLAQVAGNFGLSSESAYQGWLP